MKINIGNYEIFEKVQNITRTDYEIVWTDKQDLKGYIDEEGILAMLEDLVCEVDRLKEEIEDLQQPNDFDPELEIPKIHGEGISW